MPMSGLSTATVPLLAAVALAIGVVGTKARADDEDDETPTISVNGTGKVSAVPDVAEINVGVQTQANTAREALSANNRAMAALVDALKQQGIDAKDVQTSQIQVNPQYTQPQPRPGVGIQPQQDFVPRIAAYQVINSVQLTAREIAKLGEVLDAVVQAGGNQINGISFRVDQPEKLMDQARRSAMADAKHKANLLAEEAGVTVGPPRSIQESGGPAPPPRPMMYAARAAMAESVPVSAGEQELVVTVHVVYELRPRE